MPITILAHKKNVCPILRVGRNDPSLIKKAFDINEQLKKQNISYSCAALSLSCGLVGSLAHCGSKCNGILDEPDRGVRWIWSGAELHVDVFS